MNRRYLLFAGILFATLMAIQPAVAAKGNDKSPSASAAGDEPRAAAPRKNVTNVKAAKKKGTKPAHNVVKGVPLKALKEMAK